MYGVDPCDADAVEAIMRSEGCGFRTLRLGRDGKLVAIQGERLRAGTLDAYTVREAREAYAARYRAVDYPEGQPLWRRSGTAAEVIAELLALPEPDTASAAAFDVRH